MAKMFLKETEACKELLKTPEEIKQLTREGRLREFRDGPRLMYKADQVYALRDELGLMEPATTGIISDPGSGLLDLIRDEDEPNLDLDKESDDTALGSELLNEIASEPLIRKYKYEAMNASGREEKGTVEAESQEEAIAKIRAKGLFPTKVRKSGQVYKAEQAVSPGVIKTLLYSLFGAKMEKTDDILHRAYEEFENHENWKVIEQALKDLEKHGDIEITNNAYFVIGYLVKAIAKNDKSK